MIDEREKMAERRNIIIVTVQELLLIEWRHLFLILLVVLLAINDDIDVVDDVPPPSSAAVVVEDGAIDLLICVGACNHRRKFSDHFRAPVSPSKKKSPSLGGGFTFQNKTEIYLLHDEDEQGVLAPPPSWLRAADDEHDCHRPR